MRIPVWTDPEEIDTIDESDCILLVKKKFDWAETKELYKQPPPDHKPYGIWYSLGKEWIEFIYTEWVRQYHGFVYKLLLDKSTMLQLDTIQKMEEFIQEYQVGRHEIAWAHVAAAYDGIEIAPWHYQIKMLDRFSWYYGWDVASGCIWYPDRVIVDFELIGKIRRDEDDPMED